jgi:hypothetical protein
LFLVFKIDRYDSHNREDDASRQGEGIKGQEDRIQERKLLRMNPGENEVEHRFSEKDDQQGQPQRGPVDIRFDVRHVDPVDLDERIEQPSGQDPEDDGDEDGKAFN